ncbi:MAG: HAD-IA family hydrolase [Thermocrispum sp.]
MIGAVWTDFGGVITPPTAVTMTAFCQRLEVDPQHLQEAMRAVGDSYGTDTMAPLDTPLITEDEWAAQVERVLRERHGSAPDLSGFGAKWFADRDINTAWLRWLADVRAGGRFVGVLSNMVPAWDEHWRAMVGSVEQFDGEVLSFRVGCRKPEPEIFALAAERAGVPSEQCVLVDDLAANCAGAEAAGWRAVHYTDHEAAVAELDALLATPRPAA